MFAYFFFNLFSFSYFSECRLIQGALVFLPSARCNRPFQLSLQKTMPNHHCIPVATPFVPCVAPFAPVRPAESCRLTSRSAPRSCSRRLVSLSCHRSAPQPRKRASEDQCDDHLLHTRVLAHAPLSLAHKVLGISNLN